MKSLDEMMDEINDGLTVKIKMSHLLEKSMKKSWGKYKAFEIALGRKMMKLIHKQFDDSEVIPKNSNNPA